MKKYPTLIVTLVILGMTLVMHSNTFAAETAPPAKTEPGKKDAPKQEPDKKSKQDGFSYETAIVIKEKKSDKGVAAEYAWLKKKLPGHKVLKQSLDSKGDKKYDVFEVRLRDGTERKVYFDITGFFGKY
ncbi:MAG: hypothetical protein LBV12_03190 [Puniceicoccales bacterium]|jgi:hypothetical protein|nr:hypothetical protein [Puniceicoccales bacterium]